MNSSTSSSRSELKILLALLLILVLCEAGVRLAMTHLSGDEIHIAQIPDLTHQLSLQSGPRILFVGNSLTRAGINPVEFNSELQETTGDSVSLALATPDDTVPLNWYYLVKNFVLNQDQLPHIICLGISNFHVIDGAEKRIRKLGRTYCRLKDIPEIYRTDLTSFDERAELLLSGLLYSYATQDRIKKRVLDLLIPDYRTNLRRITEMGRAGSQDEDEGVREYSFNGFGRLLELIAGNQILPVVVAMPLQDDWEVDAALMAVIGSTGALFLDARQIDGLSAADFKDNMHLTPVGARKLSRFLARRLSQTEPAAAIITGI